MGTDGAFEVDPPDAFEVHRMTTESHLRDTGYERKVNALNWQLWLEDIGRRTGHAVRPLGPSEQFLVEIGRSQPVTASASDCGGGAADQIDEIMQPKRPQTGFGELACGGHCQCHSCANSCRNRTAPVEGISPRDAFKVRADCAS